MLNDQQLANLLASSRLLNVRRIQQLQSHAAQHGYSFYQTVLRSGDFEEQRFIRLLAKKLGVRHAQLAGRSLDPRLLTILPRNIIETHQVLPLGTGQNNGRKVVYVAMLDPTDENTIAIITQHLRRSIVPVLAGPLELEAAIAHCANLTSNANRVQKQKQPTQRQTNINSRQRATTRQRIKPSLRTAQQQLPRQTRSNQAAHQRQKAYPQNSFGGDLLSEMHGEKGQMAGVLEMLEEPQEFHSDDDATPKSGLFQLNHLASQSTPNVRTMHHAHQSIFNEDSMASSGNQNFYEKNTLHPTLEKASVDQLIRATIAALIKKGYLTEDEIIEEL